MANLGNTTTEQDVAVDIDVLPNDTDADGDILTVTNVFDLFNGFTAKVNPDGKTRSTTHPRPRLQRPGCLLLGGVQEYAAGRRASLTGRTTFSDGPTRLGPKAGVLAVLQFALTGQGVQVPFFDEARAATL